MKTAALWIVRIIAVGSFVTLAIVSQASTALENDPLETGPSVTCEELHLALGVKGSELVVRFCLVDFGGPFHIVHAALLPIPTISDPDHQPILMSGTGQVIIAEHATLSRPVYYMNLHYSQEHADLSPDSYWHDGRIAQIRLELLTGEGTFWMVGTDHNEAQDWESNGYDEFTIAVKGELPDCLKKAIPSESL